MTEKSISSQKLPNQVVQMKKEPLVLTCEWSDCTKLFYRVQEMMEHINNVHLNQPQETDANNIKCMWKDCGGSMNNKEFIRHTYFHVFHAKIKCIGHNLLRRKGVICSLGSIGRNVIPELPNDFECGWTNCRETFINPELFYRHVEKHAESTPRGNNPKGGVTCLWENCNSHFQSQHKLRDHLHTHSQEKVVACPTCGAFFANRTKLIDHVKRQVPMQEFQCTHCSKCFSSERLLRDHMRIHVNHYKCPYCDMTCPSPSGLNTHVKYRHTDVKPYVCFLCDYTCKSHSDLRRHVNTHSAEAPNKCCYANCTFTSRSFQSLVNHVRKVHQGMKAGYYKCHICDKTFNRGSILSQHLIKQHKFQWPSGHSRFRYKCSEDGFYRLQTVRYESIELMQMTDVDPAEDVDDTAEELSSEAEKSCTVQSSVINVPVVLNDAEDDVLISIEQTEDGRYVMQTVMPDAQGS